MSYALAFVGTSFRRHRRALSLTLAVLGAIAVAPLFAGTADRFTQVAWLMNVGLAWLVATLVIATVVGSVVAGLLNAFLMLSAALKRAVLWTNRPPGRGTEFLLARRQSQDVWRVNGLAGVGSDPGAGESELGLALTTWADRNRYPLVAVVPAPGLATASALTALGFDPMRQASRGRSEVRRRPG